MPWIIYELRIYSPHTRKLAHGNVSHHQKVKSLFRLKQFWPSSHIVMDIFLWVLSIQTWWSLQDTMGISIRYEGKNVCLFGWDYWGKYTFIYIYLYVAFSWTLWQERICCFWSGSNATGRSLHCQVQHHMWTKSATLILHAIDNFRFYDIFFYIYITIDSIF